MLLLEDPSRLAGPVPPGLTGLSIGGDHVRWLWLVPITAEEHRYAKNEGSDALVRRLAQQGRSWVVS
ncbi:suppressor of fused domain protein [Actinomadura keratinilytica]|uniref:suppressor of fused domain protein n=1 Tax=Actinomadura keratinilytica TaxID=547461 RepID=UPI00360B906C